MTRWARSLAVLIVLRSSPRLVDTPDSQSAQPTHYPPAYGKHRSPCDDLPADSAAVLRYTGQVARGLHECLDQCGFPQRHGQHETSVEHHAEHRHFGCQGTACKPICRPLGCEIHRRSRCIDGRSSRSPEYNHHRQTARKTPPPTTHGKPKRRTSRRRSKTV